MDKNIETYDSDLTLIKESASELQNITHSIAVKYDDLIKVLEGYEYDVLEDHEYVKENIKAIDSLAKEMLQNTAVLYSTLNDRLHELYTHILNSEKSSLDEFLEDDPEGFMDDWDEYKRTPVDGKMVLYAVPGESKIVNIDKDEKSEEDGDKNTNNTEDIEIDMKLVDTPIPGPYFHGESWFRCPKCKIGFEYFDTKFERGFVHIKGKIYKHTQNDCNQLIDMS